MSLTTIIAGLKLMGGLSGQPDVVALEGRANQIEQDTTKTEQVETLKSNMEFLETGDENRKGRLNLFYDLPGKSSSYTFIEFDGDGFFIRGMGYTPINKNGTGLTSQVKISNKFPNHATVGLEQRVSFQGIKGGVRLLPVWFDKDGYKNNFSTVVVYGGKSFDLPIGKTKFDINVSAFGEVNVNGKDDCGNYKAQWLYGEANAQVGIPTKAGKFEVGAGYNFNSNGNFLPEPMFRVKVGYHPKK